MDTSGPLSGPLLCAQISQVVKAWLLVGELCQGQRVGFSGLWDTSSRCTLCYFWCVDLLRSSPKWGFKYYHSRNGLDWNWNAEGWSQQEQGIDHPPVLGTGESSPWVLCSVLGPSLQEGHRNPGICPKKNTEGVRCLEHKSFSKHYLRGSLDFSSSKLCATRALLLLTVMWDRMEGSAEVLPFLDCILCGFGLVFIFLKALCPILCPSLQPWIQYGAGSWAQRPRHSQRELPV